MSNVPKFYLFRWRRHLLWRCIKVIGHRYDSHQDKLVAFRYPDGGLLEIKNWSNCEAELGKDWATVTAAQQKEALEAGNSGRRLAAAMRPVQPAQSAIPAEAAPAGT